MNYIDKHFRYCQKSNCKWVSKASAPYYPINDHSNQLNIAQELHNGHQGKSEPSGIDKKSRNWL